MFSGLLERAPHRCTFEESLCGFVNDVDNGFNWTVSVQHRDNYNGSQGANEKQESSNTGKITTSNRKK